MQITCSNNLPPAEYRAITARVYADNPCFRDSLSSILTIINNPKGAFAKRTQQQAVMVKGDDGNPLASALLLQAEGNTKQTLPGVYCIRTCQNWDEKTLWSTYTMLTDVEAVFRSLKSELGLRPVFHQQTERVTGHLFISVLAYHLIQAIRYRLKKSRHSR